MTIDLDMCVSEVLHFDPSVARGLSLVGVMLFERVLHEKLHKLCEMVWCGGDLPIHLPPTLPPPTRRGVQMGGTGTEARNRGCLVLLVAKVRVVRLGVPLDAYSDAGKNAALNHQIDCWLYCAI